MLTPMSPFAGLTGLTAGPDRLAELEDFGSNPGNLRAWTYVPQIAAPKRPLVIVLHGCTQTAAAYDTGAGWSTLADEQGFMLLFPEQQRANNPNLCFNWFSPNDIRRDAGEALSIREMIATLVNDHGADPDRIFITGLSAGGAMASVMLATYPEVFAGGAIIAGLPYGSAKGVPAALDRMRGQGLPDAAALDALVRRASDHAGPWPTISVWHGDRDATVNSANADAIVSQWRSVHGISDGAGSVETGDGYTRRIWRNAEQGAVIEHYTIPAMGHGTPLDTAGSDGCGKPGPFMLDVGVSSTRRIAAFWGLGQRQQGKSEAPAAAAQSQNSSTRKQPVVGLPILRSIRPARVHSPKPEKTAAKGVGKIIEDALRAAGLMR
jgi:poly(hydroxyalkanoate) depolymerase family esterase